MRLPIPALLLSLGACGSVAATPDAQVTADAPAGDACVPETEAQLCARITGCESRTATDNCGASRTVDCGACSGGQACVVGQCQVPECTGFSFTGQQLAGFNRPNVKDGVNAATWDARTILRHNGPEGVCAASTLTIADEMIAGSGTYSTLDVTETLARLGMATDEFLHTLTADGLTVIGPSSARNQIVSTTRSARGVRDFGAVSPTAFANINATFSDPVTVRGLTISADGLELYYTLNGHTAADTAKDGIYRAVRTSATAPFAAGTKLPPPVDGPGNEFVSGISADRLTLFVFNGFRTRVYTRSSTSGAFVNPNAPAATPELTGWNIRPLAGCTRLLAQVSTGGCIGEDIEVRTRQ